MFSRADGWWFPVDPVRGLVNKRKVFDPSSQPPTAAASYAANGLAPGVAFGMGLAPRRGSAASTSVSASTSAAGGGKASQSQVIRDNRMLYVLAFEEDGFARDVTRRYARQYNAKIVKAQGGSIGGGRMARRMWWEGVVGCVTRPYRLVKYLFSRGRFFVCAQKRRMEVLMRATRFVLFPPSPFNFLCACSTAMMSKMKNWIKQR